MAQGFWDMTLPLWLPTPLLTWYRPPGAEPSCPRDSWAFSVSLGELKSIRRSKPGLSWAYLVLVTQAGGSLPALHFHRGGTRALLRVLSRYLLLAR